VVPVGLARLWSVWDWQDPPKVSLETNKYHDSQSLVYEEVLLSPPKDLMGVKFGWQNGCNG
jgi:hypothetical protein